MRLKNEQSVLQQRPFYRAVHSGSASIRGDKVKSYRLQEFKRPLEAEQLATPAPRGSEVLLKVVAAGMCHSDLHLWDGGYDLGRGDRLSLTDRGVRLPLTLGHETVGEVVALGSEAHGVEVGKTYLIFPWIGCGECQVCLTGNETYCTKPRFLGILRDGGYADHIVVPHSKYLLDISGLDISAAAPYACSGVTTYSALKKAGPAIYDGPIVIFGAGGLGLMSLGLLRAMGGKGAVVVEVSDQKRAAAIEAGALATVDGRAKDAVDEIIRTVGGSPKVQIDFVGSEQTAALSFNCAPKGGKIIMVGLFGGAAPWPLPLIAMKALTIQGNYLGSLEELGELLELIRKKSVPPIPITLARLDDVNEMLDTLREGKVVGRVVLSP
jgi:alcohol dehydrogenase, propanol-preferring